MYFTFKLVITNYLYARNQQKIMKTYIEILHSADGAKVSQIFQILSEMGLKSAVGEHDFVYVWEETVPLPTIIEFLDRVISRLKCTGAILKFTTIR